MREHVGNFVQTYQRAYNREPNGAAIKSPMEHIGRPNVVSWLKCAILFKVNDLAQRSVTLVKLTDASKYNWIVAEVVRTLSIINTKVDIRVVVVTVGDPSDWSVIPVDLEKMICSYFCGLVPFF